MAESRLPGVLDYLEKLVRLPVEISRCSHVIAFFESERRQSQSQSPTQDDTELGSVPMKEMAAASPSGTQHYKHGAVARTASYLEVGAAEPPQEQQPPQGHDLQQYQAQQPVQ